MVLPKPCLRQLARLQMTPHGLFCVTGACGSQLDPNAALCWLARCVFLAIDSKVEYQRCPQHPLATSMNFENERTHKTQTQHNTQHTNTTHNTQIQHSSCLLPIMFASSLPFGSDALSATVSSTPRTRHVEGSIVVSPPAPSVTTISSAAPVVTMTTATGDKKPTLQQRIARVKRLRQTMREACKDMLLAVQRAYEVFKLGKYAGPKAEPTFVPCSAFEDVKLWELLVIDVTTRVGAHNESSRHTYPHSQALLHPTWFVCLSRLWYAFRMNTRLPAQFNVHTTFTPTPWNVLWKQRHSFPLQSSSKALRTQTVSEPKLKVF